MAKPNILMIIVDSLRADHVSCYGYHRETTPNIDRLAAEGCLFEAAITAAPFSPASYASLFSNLYPHQHGVDGDMVRIWPDSFTRLAERMKENAYGTFGISNNDFVGTRCNAATGFDRYVDAWGPSWPLRQHRRAIRAARKYLGERTARWVESNRAQCVVKGDSVKTIRLARDMIRARGDHPFFGFLVLMDPHAPYDRRRREFVPKSKAVPTFFRQVNAGNMWVNAMASGSGPDSTNLRIATDCYDSEIHFADHCIGELLDCLRQQGILDETVVIVAADHGEAFGEHGVWGHGFCLNDCVTRVPLIIRCPEYWAAGQRSPALVQLHDVHELCVSIATDGNPRPDQFRHCLTRASDPLWRGREMVFSEFSVQTQTLKLMAKLNPAMDPGRWAQPMWAVRTGEWRYIEFGNESAELFDLVNDPGETHSVLGEHRTVADNLREQLERHRCDRTAAEPAPSAAGMDVDDVVVQRLRDLGYVE